MPLFVSSNRAATLTCFLPRSGIATSNPQNNFWQCLGLAARHSCGDTCSVTSTYNWKECYGDNILLSGGQHNVTAVWVVYLCPASTSFTWHGYCTFVKHPGTLLPRCMLCRALDRKHRQMGFFWFIIIIVTTTFFFLFYFTGTLSNRVAFLQAGLNGSAEEQMAFAYSYGCDIISLIHMVTFCLRRGLWKAKISQTLCLPLGWTAGAIWRRLICSGWHSWLRESKLFKLQEVKL